MQIHTQIQILVLILVSSLIQIQIPNPSLVPEGNYLHCQSCPERRRRRHNDTEATFDTWISSSLITVGPADRLSEQAKPTCEGEEHASGLEEVVPAPALPPRTGAHEAEGAQDHEGQAEDGDGGRRDVELWGQQEVSPG